VIKSGFFCRIGEKGGGILNIQHPISNYEVRRQKTGKKYHGEFAVTNFLDPE